MSAPPLRPSLSTGSRSGRDVDEEPDEDFKRALKDEIERDMNESTVQNAREEKDERLKAAANDEERKLIEADWEQSMKTYRRLATERYEERMKAEKQRRRGLVHPHKLPQQVAAEQQAILDAIQGRPSRRPDVGNALSSASAISGRDNPLGRLRDSSTFRPSHDETYATGESQWFPSSFPYPAPVMAASSAPIPVGRAETIDSVTEGELAHSFGARPMLTHKLSSGSLSSVRSKPDSWRTGGSPSDIASISRAFGFATSSPTSIPTRRDSTGSNARSGIVASVPRSSSPPVRLPTRRDSNASLASSRSGPTSSVSRPPYARRDSDPRNFSPSPHVSASSPAQPAPSPAPTHSSSSVMPGSSPVKRENGSEEFRSGLLSATAPRRHSPMPAILTPPPPPLAPSLSQGEYRQNMDPVDEEKPLTRSNTKGKNRSDGYRSSGVRHQSSASDFSVRRAESRASQTSVPITSPQTPDFPQTPESYRQHPPTYASGSLRRFDFDEIKGIPIRSPAHVVEEPQSSPSPSSLEWPRNSPVASIGRAVGRKTSFNVEERARAPSASPVSTRMFYNRPSSGYARRTSVGSHRSGRSSRSQSVRPDIPVQPVPEDWAAMPTYEEMSPGSDQSDLEDGEWDGIFDYDDHLRQREEETLRKEEELRKKEVEINRKEEEARRKEEQACVKEEEARRKEVLARKKEEEARRKEEFARRRELEVKRKEEEAMRKEEGARKMEEEARRMEEDARKMEEDARKMEEDARKKEEDARRMEEDARRIEEEARKKEEDAERLEEELKKIEEDTRKRSLELKKKEEDARRKEEDARRREEEARRREEDARRREEDARKKEEDARRKEEDARRREEDARERADEAKQRADEARQRAEEARIREDALRQKEEEIRRREEIIRRREDELERMRRDAQGRRQAEEELRKQQEELERIQTEWERRQQDDEDSRRRGEEKEVERLKLEEELRAKAAELELREAELRRHEEERRTVEYLAELAQHEKRRYEELVAEQQSIQTDLLRQREARRDAEALAAQLQREEEQRAHDLAQQEELRRVQLQAQEEERRAVEALAKERRAAEAMAQEEKRKAELEQQRKVEAIAQQKEELRRQQEAQEVRRRLEEARRIDEERRMAEFTRRQEELQRQAQEQQRRMEEQRKRQDTFGNNPEVPRTGTPYSSASQSYTNWTPGTNRFSSASTASSNSSTSSNWPYASSTSSSKSGASSQTSASSATANASRAVPGWRPTTANPFGPTDAANARPAAPEDRERTWRERQEEHARRQAEAFQREQERLERERLARAGKVMSKEDVLRLFEEHERIWLRIPTLDMLSWNSFAWPMLKKPSSPEELTTAAISAYVLNSYLPQDRSDKDRIKEHIKRWHPDRFETKLLPKVRSDEREKVKEGAGQVVRSLNELLTKSGSSLF